MTSKSGSTWRDHAAPIIARVIRETQGQDLKAIQKALFEAYPFGERKYHPYKIWLDECKVQLKRAGFKTDRKRRGAAIPDDGKQMTMKI